MGVTLSFDEECDVIMIKGIVYKHVDVENVTVHEFGETTIILSKLKLTAVVGGNEVINPFVVTEVYTSLNGDIKLASMSYRRLLA